MLLDLDGEKNKYVLTILVDCVFIITNFDLWMSKGTYNVFALVMNFLREDWVTKHITIGLFYFFEISNYTWVKEFTRSFKTIWIDEETLECVKDESLNTMIVVLKLVVYCETCGETFLRHMF